VGSIVARYGAVFLASMQQNSVLTLVDGDSFEPSNSTRMVFGRCGNKAGVIHRELSSRFKHSKLSMDWFSEYITPGNIDDLIIPGDIVLLCVDNHATRRMVNEHCKTLKNICLISGGNDGVDKDHRGTYGNAQIYVRKNGKDITADLAAFHPEIAHPRDRMPFEPSCTALVASTPQILFSNLAVASAMLNTLLLYLSNATHYGELCFDIAEGRMAPTIGVK